MSVNNMLQWITLIGMLLGAGIWLGRLQSQATTQKNLSNYLYGDVAVPASE
jgi:hypothetical protein